MKNDWMDEHVVILRKTKEKEFAIIGLGRFGGSLARRLETLGHPVLGIDIDPRLVKEIADEITEAVVLDATDEDALRQVDITAFQTVVVAIADNFEANALITSTLKKLGIPHVISESNSQPPSGNFIAHWGGPGDPTRRRERLPAGG